MRLRRVLITDVYTTLERVGHIELGALRTPDSSDGGVRRGRARDVHRRTHGRKRLCKRKPETDDEASSEYSLNEGQAYLAHIMIELANRSGLDTESCIREDRNSVEMANLLHDGLVKVWTGPYQEDGDHFESLREMADVWKQHKRNNPPRSSQRERNATPGTP
ncbi:hypothetical protein G6514_007004 [Epicoccum nigrum]|nr:hypothetical protein G6514_007004 [Epicoccum nigrum]